MYDLLAMRPSASDPKTAHSTDYRELVERIPAVSYTAEFGSTCEWHFVSPQVEQLLGYRAEEWCADPGLWFRLVHPDDREAVLEAESRTLTEATRSGSATTPSCAWTRAAAGCCRD
jgi:PAS domain S-box-containing protein